MIDVIIPSYNAHKTIMNTLLSIYYQDISSNINVYICNDCSDKDYKDEVCFFDGLMNVKELKLIENSGPGIARQVGLDNSHGDYIVFMDSDDTLASPYAISKLLKPMVEENLDIVIGDFIEEEQNQTKIRSKDTVWLHGKMYRRSFLEKHKIRFNSTRANEDNGFNQSIFLRNPKYKYVNEIIYQWRYNPNSITRKNNSEYRFTGLIGYVYNITWALESAINDEEDYYDNIAELATACLDAMWYYYSEFMDNEGSFDLVKNTKNVYNITKKYPIKDKNREEKLHQQQYNYFVNDLTPENVKHPRIAFADFTKLIEGVDE